jgi:pSer/pThr/pTyr-binding forkhead associated (FHA) protein
MVNGRPMLRDYQSLNGTFLNAKLDVGVSEAALGNGDLVQFGGAGGDQYQFVVH